MTKNYFSLKFWAMIIALFAGFTFASCGKEDEPIDPNNPPVVGVLTELTSPITENTTLKDLGLPIDYVYKGTNLLEVKNNATLTIEDSVTIQFTDKNGGIWITDGATIKALGTAGKHIQFVGGATKGSWQGITVETNTENQLKYVDFINGGSFSQTGVIYLVMSGARLAVDNCTISGSKGSGVFLENNDNLLLTSFQNNKISGCDNTPLHLFGAYNLAVLDKTSDLTGNAVNYVEMHSTFEVDAQNLTINPTTVPYYFNAYAKVSASNTLIINAGTTMYFHADVSFQVNDGAHIVVNGGTGVGEKVTFSHLPNSTAYWQGFEFFDSHGNILKNCLIEYGGNPNNDANIYAYARSSMSLENVELNNSKMYGFKFINSSYPPDMAQVTSVNVTFSGNAGGNVFLPDETVSATMP
ncbi:MAG: right-handed parallel beta-helix repeat-containing protein [Prevotellaceae bacterium]|jgi:hypothetical protein|nr:right-handed parallel beta-helix repeat-containing protein [Prevotellaceae bacterium]